MRQKRISSLIRILGIDPGLGITGWGIIDYDGFRLKHISHGTIVSRPIDEMSVRLGDLFKKLSGVIENNSPDEISIEQIFVNSNPISSLKLGMARGVAICVSGIIGLNVTEYPANKIKKTIVGSGHATKNQISVMVQKLLNCGPVKLDAADALAIAICHAHHRSMLKYAV